MKSRMVFAEWWSWSALFTRRGARRNVHGSEDFAARAVPAQLGLELFRASFNQSDNHCDFVQSFQAGDLSNGVMDCCRIPSELVIGGFSSKVLSFMPQISPWTDGVPR